METFKNLQIQTVTVSINVITVSGKKMTISVFNQIQNEDCFDEKFNFLGDNIFGYVIDKDQDVCIVYTKNNQLRKWWLNQFFKFIEIDFDNEIFGRHETFFKQVFNVPHYIGYWDKIKLFFSEDEILTVKNLQENAKSFWHSLKDNQIFIAI